MTWIVVVIAIVVCVGLVAFFATTRKHPENASGHTGPARSGSAQMFGDADQNPAGPGTEDMNVVADGQAAPGASADNLGARPDRQTSASTDS